MCLTFWVKDFSSEVPFAIVFNRDEDNDRPAEPLKFQGERGFEHIVCGIDSLTQTTWFAFNKHTGRFACLTNYRTMRNRN